MELFISLCFSICFEYRDDMECKIKRIKGLWLFIVVVLLKLLERIKLPLTEMGTVSLGERKMNHSVFVLQHYRIFLYLVYKFCQNQSWFFSRGPKLFDSEFFSRGLENRYHQENFFLFHPWASAHTSLTLLAKVVISSSSSVGICPYFPLCHFLR